MEIESHGNNCHYQFRQWLAAVFEQVPEALVVFGELIEHTFDFLKVEHSYFNLNLPFLSHLLSIRSKIRVTFVLCFV